MVDYQYLIYSTIISKDTTKIYFCPQTIEGELQLHKKTKIIENSAFYGCSSITAIGFNENLDSIQPLSFYGCSKLKELIFPKGLLYIGDRAFDGCSSVTNISLSNTIKELGFGCFYYTKISNITIPGSIEILNDKVFYVCDNLFSVNIRCATPPKRTSHLFPLRRQMELHVLKGLKALYESTEFWKDYANIYDDLDWINVSEILIPQNEYHCNINETIKASAFVLPDDADAPYPIWSSDDESIVYIDKNGTFIGLKEGTTNIVATASDGSGIFSKARVHVHNTAKIESVDSYSKEAKEVRRFALDGTILSSPVKGINIVILNNGAVYKEIIR